jgi:hypothetical protein
VALEACSDAGFARFVTPPIEAAEGGERAAMRFGGRDTLTYQIRFLRFDVEMELVVELALELLAIQRS